MSNASPSPASQSNTLTAGAKSMATVLVAAFALAALQSPAAARQCKRICMEGQCWYDCSKIPGERSR